MTVKCGDVVRIRQSDGSVISIVNIGPSAWEKLNGEKLGGELSYAHSGAIPTLVENRELTVQIVDNQYGKIAVGYSNDYESLISEMIKALWLEGAPLESHQSEYDFIFEWSDGPVEVSGRAVVYLGEQKVASLPLEGVRSPLLVSLQIKNIGNGKQMIDIRKSMVAGLI